MFCFGRTILSVSFLDCSIVGVFFNGRVLFRCVVFWAVLFRCVVFWAVLFRCVVFWTVLFQTIHEAEKSELGRKGKEFAEEFGKTASKAAESVSKGGEQIAQSHVFKSVKSVSPHARK